MSTAKFWRKRDKIWLAKDHGVSAEHLDYWRHVSWSFSISEIPFDFIGHGYLLGPRRSLRSDGEFLCVFVDSCPTVWAPLGEFVEVFLSVDFADF